ncbi:hypothetical protein E1N52_38020 [Paraburkholderia guartelaensis]|uniref:Nitrogenase-stabilizing/protective protein NifW n=1 Tax=Paraburkholderia guartelaensis TaxID=2546446 RepID=A0A4R5L2F9_9BURK|nr:hypothetical protein E1N52_38020 [Paraburkholderia guartelaensis]
MEDFRVFCIALDERIVKLNRLHIMKRFLRYIKYQNDTPPPRRLTYHGLLRKACDDFVVSRPPEQRVFKVVRRPQTGMSSSSKACARCCRHAAASDQESLNAYCRLHQASTGFCPDSGSPCDQHHHAARRAGNRQPLRSLLARRSVAAKRPLRRMGHDTFYGTTTGRGRTA